ncbi:tetratricopeptide repeat protein [bacterium]|nr:tetratricopeptide repeat protein [bacterium]
MEFNPFKNRAGTRIGPGLRRLVLPVDQPRALANPKDLPLSLTLREGEDRHGILAPDGSTPWGCLFFMIFGASLLVAIFSRNWAVVVSLGGLILLWGFYNHPRRKASEPMMRALGRIGQGQSGEALREMELALEAMPDSDAVHYLAALARATSGHWDRALEHLDLAELKFRDYAEYYHVRGMARKALGQNSLAMEDFQRALEFREYPQRGRLDRELQ